MQASGMDVLLDIEGTRDGLNKMMGWTPASAKNTEPWPSPLCRGQPVELSWVAVGE